MRSYLCLAISKALCNQKFITLYETYIKILNGNSHQELD